eukprot:CAMPEP_0183545304 /NCGR_PEP_ID=MMETSP0371-20130417/51481_1 /TAXON_ID=268820 /ORGANISM="Peridinium aciculiferum, Strain PAER-2" /LENGTH=128 /DNA_ID=CAMNT_0025747401 /DNA_START=493 /DNA_END=880 /DNA_ORIENTATION=+
MDMSIAASIELYTWTSCISLPVGVLRACAGACCAARCCATSSFGHGIGDCVRGGWPCGGPGPSPAGHSMAADQLSGELCCASLAPPAVSVGSRLGNGLLHQQATFEAWTPQALRARADPRLSSPGQRP